MRNDFRLLSIAIASLKKALSVSVIKIACKSFHSEALSSMFTISDKVQGITALTENDKKLFRKEITLPVVLVPPKCISRIIGCQQIASRTVERFCNKIKPIINAPAGDEKAIVFCPEKMNDDARDDIAKAIKDLADVTARFDSYRVTLEYDDWPAKSLISAILPEKLEFGTVVNKLDAIGHKYRTFELDLLAGEENYKTEVHEDNLRYQLDFSQVFFNPRLGTEHKRIVKKIGKRSVFYDCCAGVGPFVLPALRNGVHRVLANDLNPGCIEYLKRNAKLNRLSFERLQTYNMDAALFITTVLADDLAKQATNLPSSDPENKTPADAHVVMNLPGMSLQFLPSFRGCLRNKDNLSGSLPFPLYVHCHFFVKAPDDFEDDWYYNEARNLVRKSVGMSNLEFTEVRFVRNVAGRKKMFCASFQVPDEILFASAAQDEESRHIDRLEAKEPKEDSGDGNNEKRICAERISSRRQAEEVGPEAKKKKMESIDAQ